MRVLGIDFGQRRIGLAISDPSGTLARPLMTLTVASLADALDRLSVEITRLVSDADGLETVVVGLPIALDGSPTAATARTTAFMAALKARVPVTIVGGEERLSSREAESRLSLRERDWRRRKEKLDAAAAAVILQDYLNEQRPWAEHDGAEDPDPDEE